MIQRYENKRWVGGWRSREWGGGVGYRSSSYLQCGSVPLGPQAIQQSQVFRLLNRYWQISRKRPMLFFTTTWNISCFHYAFIHDTSKIIIQFIVGQNIIIIINFSQFISAGRHEDIGCFVSMKHLCSNWLTWDYCM